MAKALAPQEQALYQAIDEILWQHWDPIGICSSGGLRNEYETYVPQVFQLALKGDRGQIADYLFTAAVKRMGLTTQRNQHLAVADKILAAKAAAGVADGDA